MRKKVIGIMITLFISILLTVLCIVNLSKEYNVLLIYLSVFATISVLMIINLIDVIQSNKDRS